MLRNLALLTKRKLLLAGALSLAFTLTLVAAAVAGPSGLPPVSKFLGHAGLFDGNFAIADLDGDALPDLATVSVNGTASPHTSYSIRLHLSGNSDLAFGVTAPWGGLQIYPRDVNGDDTLDLVITTALDSQLVVVLLNDGHGNFTSASPASFPLLEASSDTRFASQLPLTDARETLCPSRSSFGEQSDTSRMYALPNSGTPCRTFSLQAAVSSPCPTRPGRAPPDCFLFS